MGRGLSVAGLGVRPNFRIGLVPRGRRQGVNFPNLYGLVITVWPCDGPRGLVFAQCQIVGPMITGKDRG